MGKEQTGREGKGRGLTTNEARKSNFREGKGGSQPSGGTEQNHRPQNIAVHLMARREGAIQGRQIKTQLKSEVSG